MMDGHPLDVQRRQTKELADRVDRPVPNVAVLDNCDDAAKIQLKSKPEKYTGGSGLPGDPKIIERSVEATDTCGNTSSGFLVQQIYVELPSFMIKVTCSRRVPPLSAQLQSMMLRQRGC